MRMVYTHENRFFVGNAKNLLEAQRIAVILKNEYASSAAGEVSPFDTWLELWVPKDSDYDRAVEVLESAMSQVGAPAWFCQTCKEENDASFASCWNCQTALPE